jgi:2-methylcitrate dehydratase PrpD
MTGVADIAAWAADLRPADIPADVLRLCRDQRRSVLASVAASTRDGAARRVLEAVAGWAQDGPVALVGTGRAVSVDDAIYGAAALSMALDFDDYVCFGHTGHSAGLRAARLAAAGVTGPVDALEHPEGFLSAFADAPLPGMLGGLGEGWATRTLCVKRAPPARRSRAAGHAPHGLAPA